VTQSRHQSARSSDRSAATPGESGGESDHATFDLLDSARPLTALDRLVDKAGRGVAVLFLIAVAISFYEIVLRYAFNAPTIWVHETVIGLIAVCYAFGGAFALARDSHIRISLITAISGPRTRLFLHIVNSAFSLLFAVALGWAAWLMTEKAWFAPTGELRLDRSGSAWNPPLPALVKGALLVCLILMAVQALIQLIYWLRSDAGTVRAREDEDA
jgi:TRAP-type C4-dicarboxylate transport system permease small subunit